MSTENDKLLNLMRFWIFGTVVIVLVAVTLFAGMIVGLEIFGELLYWLIVIITVVLGVIWYYGYKWYQNRQG